MESAQAEFEPQVQEELHQEIQPEVRQPGYFDRGYVRTFIGAAIVILALMVLGSIGWSMYRSTHNRPIDVDAYPGAKIVVADTFPHADRTLSSTGDSVQQVIDFYSNKLSKDGGSACGKYYTDKTPSEEPGHYYGRCVVDNSIGEDIQRLQITINYQNSAKVKTPSTLIEVIRNWGN